MKKIILYIMLVFVLSCSVLSFQVKDYETASDTLILKETYVSLDYKTGYVKHNKGTLKITPFNLKSNEEALLEFNNLNSKETFDICFKGLTGYNVELNYKYIKKKVDFWFDNDLTASTSFNDYTCFMSFKNTNKAELYYNIDYNGTKKLKYDIYILPSDYNYNFSQAENNNELIILDPYLIGSLSSSDYLNLYLPFDNNIDVQHSSTIDDLVTADTREQETADTTSGTDWVQPALGYDDNFATFAYDSGSTTDVYNFYVNKTAVDTGMLFEAKVYSNFEGACDNLAYTNYSVPSECFDLYNNYVHFKVSGQSSLQPYGFSVSCEKQAGYHNFYVSGGSFYCGSSSPYKYAFYDDKYYITNTSNYTSTLDLDVNTTYRNTMGGYAVAGYDFDFNQNAEDLWGSNDGNDTNINYIDTGAVFNGTNNIKFTNNINFNSTEDFTIILKIKTNEISMTKHGLISNPTTSDSINIYGGYFGWYNGSINVITSTLILNTNDYYDLGLKRENGNNSIYINGNYIISTLSLGGDLNLSQIGINFNNIAGLNGTISDVMVYNRSLSAEEILILNNSGNFTDNILGESNQAISFNGYDNVIVQNISLPDNTISISTWIKSNTNNDLDTIIYKTSSYYFLMTHGRLMQYLSGNCYSDKYITDTNWHHLVFISNSTETKFCLDGSCGDWKNHSSCGYGVGSVDNIYIGYSPLYGNPLDGKLDELLIFDRALTEREISLLYGGFNSSVNITFIDEETNNTVSNVNVEIFADHYSESFTSTENGVLFDNGLPNDFLTIRYKKTGYTERFYYINMTSYNNTELTLYMINTTTAGNITATVYDETGVQKQSDVYIKYFRFQPETNTFNLVGIAKTNFEGKVYLPLIKNSEYYYFMLYKPFSILKLTTDQTYIYEDNLNFRITLQDTIGANFERTYDIDHSLTYNNVSRQFSLAYSNINSVATNISFELYKVSPMGSVLYNSTGSTSSAATLLLPRPNQNETTYIAKAIVSYVGEDNLIGSLENTQKNLLPTGIMGLFGVILLTLTFAFIGFYSLSIMVILTPLPLLYGSLIGLVNISIPLAILIEIVAVMVSVILKD